jgi:hypothetical protein
MDSATISALAALSGAVIGGVTSFGTSWLSQQTQAKVQARAHKLSQREELYKHFIETASKAHADSLARQAANIGEITQLVDLYALVSMMRVISSTPYPLHQEKGHRGLRRHDALQSARLACLPDRSDCDQKYPERNFTFREMPLFDCLRK